MRPGDRGGEDHPAAAARPHRRQGRAGREIGAAEVDAEHPVPFLRLDVLDQRPRIDAGVLDEDVEPAEGFHRRRHRALRIGLLRDVGGDEARRSRPAELGDRRLAGGRFHVGDHDLRPLGGEPGGDPLADAARGADDEGGAAFQPPRFQLGCHASLFRIESLTVSRSTATSTIAPWMSWV
jgi:hypothetical protein